MTVIDQLADIFGEVQTYYYIIKDTPDSTWRSAVERHKGVDKKLPCEWSPMFKAWYYGLPLSKATIKSGYKNAPETGKEIGRRPSGKNNHVAFDVDSPIIDKRQGSVFHPDNSLAEWSRLIMLIKDRIGVDIVVVRSSKSGGYHIYVFFDQWMNSDRIAHRVKEILTEEGIAIAQGQLEIFPNIRESDNAQFNGLRLPCLTEESYVVDPFTLKRIGYRETFVELAAHKNTVDIFLGRVAPAKPVLAAAKPVREAIEAAIAPVEEAKAPKKGFNLYSRLKWTPSNRSNRVLGAHVAYVIEQMGLTDPTEIEQAVWERLHEYGYKQNASATEQKDRKHVRRWIAHRLKKGDVTPLAKTTGSGDARLNEQRSEDSKFRFNAAIDAAKKAGMTFPSWNQMFKWVNRWLSQQYLATVGSSTWEKLKQAASNLLTSHTVDNNTLGQENADSTSDQTSPSPSKPKFKSVFMPTLIELGQSFVASVAEIKGGDRTIAPMISEYLLDYSPPITV